jgi:hypothetical protein
MVAQMLMQPIQRASENLGGAPFGIGADAGGSYFVDPEVAARTGYGTAVTGTSFFPGAGIVDAAGGAVDITGQPLPSFGENIREGQFTDAGLQALGVAGDIATIAAPLTGGATALLGAMMKAPRAAQKVTKATDVASDVGNIAKVEPPTETQPGIIAFHGSGADFDEFRLDKIGTGEGGRSFGYGLNFSDSKDIAKFYKNFVGGDEGKTYKVAIQPKPEEVLDYDLPLSEQPKILKNLENAFGEKELNDLSLKNAGVDSKKLTGRRLYKLLTDEYGGNKSASEELSKSGIKGSKYKPVTLDKPNPKETNFVIFDDKLIKILEKYGIVGPVAVSATAAELRDDDGST